MLEARNITKEFPGVKALDNVSVQFEKGVVHALMGENGAGKSTLMKIITGIYRPDVGAVYIDGQKVSLKNYADSVNYDISMVHQEIQVIPESTVAENIVLDKLGQFRNGLGMLDWKRMNRTAQVYLDMVEIDVKPTDVIRNMTAAQKQLIQIAKALSSDAQYILMDEPTSSLTPLRGGKPVPHPKKAQGGEPVGDLHLPQNRGGHRALRPGDGASGRQRRGHQPHRGASPGRTWCA